MLKWMRSHQMYSYFLEIEVVVVIDNSSKCEGLRMSIT